jgi:U3 small nucleolar RNA-associated protein 19
MPAKESLERSKRKRAADGEKPKKRRRSSSKSKEEDEDPNTKILLMEQGILESKKNYNDISILLSIMGEYEKGEPQSILAAVALCRVFVRLMAQGSLKRKSTSSEKEVIVVNWLKEMFSAYKTTLLSFLGDEDLAMTALTLCMKVLKTEGEHQHNNEEYSFPSTSLLGIVSAILRGNDEDVRRTYIEEYAEQYDDIRYYTFKSVK